ncbi:MAG: hypothetical protein INQ03_20920 [Candidatus Heimdallarchaeota archaeon]|nr:hypothetical protein [Candidatus Heimdallarchaeota archaeon]
MAIDDNFRIMSDTKSVLEKLQKANRIMEDLIDLAVEDKSISADEQDILFSINTNLAEYAKLIIDSVSDNVISDEEKKKIEALEQKIVDDANDIAMSDSNLSKDEKRMLTALIDAIEAI